MIRHTYVAARTVAVAAFLVAITVTLVVAAALPALASPQDLIIDAPEGTRPMTEAEGVTGRLTPQFIQSQGATPDEVAALHEAIASGAVGWVQSFTDDADTVFTILLMELPDEHAVEGALAGELDHVRELGGREEAIELPGAAAFEMPTVGLPDGARVWSVVLGRGRHLLTVSALSMSGEIGPQQVVAIARQQADRVPGAVVDPVAESAAYSAGRRSAQAVFALLLTAVAVTAAKRARRRGREGRPVVAAAPGTWGTPAAVATTPGIHWSARVDGTPSSTLGARPDRGQGWSS